MFERLFRSGTRGERAPIPLVLYTRAGCHLCEELKRLLDQADLAEPFTLREVDVAGDPALERDHGRSLPVLELEGEIVVKGRPDRAALEARFARLARTWRGAR
jgi:glutaredoxin